MAAYLMGILTGLPLGAVAFVSATTARRRLTRHEAAPDLTPVDRDTLCAEFKVHSEAVGRQVSNFADVLAGDDAELRARLRLFERK